MPDRQAIFDGFDAVTDITYATLSAPINSPKYLITATDATDVINEHPTDAGTFAGFGVGDKIEVTIDGATKIRTVTSVASIPTEVTVDTDTTDWENSGAGRAFSFRRFLSGTAATDGWFNVRGDRDRAVTVACTDFNVATSIDFYIQGRNNYGSQTPVTIATPTLTAANTGTTVVIPETVDEIRVGVGITGADTGLNTVYAFYQGKADGR